MTARLYVDWTRCQARGLCFELVPELLTPDDWGYPRSRSGAPAPRVAPTVLPHALRAVSECPRLALRIAADGLRAADFPQVGSRPGAPDGTLDEKEVDQ